MSDDERHDGRSATTSRQACPERTTGLTALQDWLITAYLVLEDARDELDDAAWSWFIAILCDVVGIEAAKVAVQEAIDATREAAA
jgi:hypothetical protein